MKNNAPGKDTEKEKKPREVLNGKGMNFQNQKILDMNIDRKEFDEDLNFLENHFQKLQKNTITASTSSRSASGKQWRKLLK